MTFFYAITAARRVTRHPVFIRPTRPTLFQWQWQMQQRNTSTSNTKPPPPDINKIYHTLLNHPIDAPPLACNIVSQVVDRRSPNKLAIRSADDTGEQEDITYEKLIARSHQIARFFFKEGFETGDSIALMLGQHPAWWYSLAGLIRQGIAVVPCSKFLTSQDLNYRINELNIKGIITAPELQKRVDAIEFQCPSLTHKITTGIGSTHWNSLADIFKQPITPTMMVQTTTETPCVDLYTSGTTGLPKVVQHNHDYLFSHLTTGRDLLQATPESLALIACDTGWGLTVWMTAAVWLMDAKLLITPTNKKFDPQKLLATLRDQPVTILCTAPATLRLLVTEYNFNQFKFPHLERIVIIGELADPELIRAFTSLGIDVSIGYGQAETPPLTRSIKGGRHIPNTIGTSVPPYHVAILNEQLHPLPAGEVGQIAMDLEKGKRLGLMRGYINAPEQTRNSFSPDGRYYLTGDYGKKNEDGSIIYHGRRDDLIKSQGYRIGPHEVESAAASHEAVRKIAVVGIPIHGVITIKAFILLKEGFSGSPELSESIQNHIKQETAHYKCPQEIEFLSLEEWSQYETISGKIRRAALRKLEETRLADQQTKEEATLHSPRPR